MFDGPVFVSGRQQVPIVPVGIGGSEAAMPKGSKFVFPRKLVFIIGDAIPPPDPGPSGRVGRQTVRSRTEELRLILQDLFDQAMERVGTPNPPAIESAE